MKTNTKKWIALAIGLAVIGGITLASSNGFNFQGAIRNRMIRGNTPRGSGNSVQQQATSSFTGGYSDLTCGQDELQPITIQVNNASQEKIGEKLMNELFDSPQMRDLIKLSLLEALPNIAEIESIGIEADHVNYYENGENGSVAISNHYNTISQFPGKFVQKVSVIAKDEGIPVNMDVKLDDGITKLYIRVILTNPQIYFDVLSPLTGTFNYGYQNFYGVRGLASSVQNGGAMANIGQDVKVVFTKFTSGYDAEHATVKRRGPNGTQIDDPALQDIARDILADNPISYIGSSLPSSERNQIDQLVNNGSAEVPPGTLIESMGSAMKLFAKLGSIFVAQKSIADGVPSSYIPELVFSQSNKVKVQACTPESHNLYDPNVMTNPYVRNGVVVTNPTGSGSNSNTNSSASANLNPNSNPTQNSGSNAPSSTGAQLGNTGAIGNSNNSTASSGVSSSETGIITDMPAQNNGISSPSSLSASNTSNTSTSSNTSITNNSGVSQNSGEGGGTSSNTSGGTNAGTDTGNLGSTNAGGTGTTGNTTATGGSTAGSGAAGDTGNNLGAPGPAPVEQTTPTNTLTVERVNYSESPIARKYEACPSTQFGYSQMAGNFTRIAQWKLTVGGSKPLQMIRIPLRVFIPTNIGTNPNEVIVMNEYDVHFTDTPNNEAGTTRSEHRYMTNVSTRDFNYNLVNALLQPGTYYLTIFGKPSQAYKDFLSTSGLTAAPVYSEILFYAANDVRNTNQVYGTFTPMTGINDQLKMSNNNLIRNTSLAEGAFLYPVSTTPTCPAS